MDVAALQGELRGFAEDRNWERYHSPKNLSVALVVEASELAEIFQWMSPEEADGIKDSEPHMARIKDEIGDVTNYLIRLSDVLDIDLEAAAWEKIRKNAAKYPAGSNTPRSAKEGDQ